MTSSDLPAEERYVTPKRKVQFVALAFAVAGLLAVALLPAYVQHSQFSSSSGELMEQTTFAPVLAEVGYQYLLVLLIPVAAAALPLVSRGRLWQGLSVASAVLLTVFAFAGSLSIGLYFVPAVITAILGALLPRSQAAQSGSSSYAAA